MSLETVRSVLLWCAIINYGLLLSGVAVCTLARGPITRVHCRLFHLSIEQFDAIQYTVLVFYKVGILLFNIVPYIALRIVM